jgi:pyrimidine-nucleoside phosphorylase
MRAVDIIIKKRAGEELSRHELQFLIGGYVSGEIPAYQAASWAMAVFFQGMTPQETASLAQVMLESGQRMDLAGIQGPFVDKHSTGGVGDKTSLILAPLLASMGVKVPMMSGRSLGHTGGTLDKLESIAGYRTALNQEEFRTILSRSGFAMTGQTKDIVPADRLLYALRDVTGTVESIPLISASILSKKAAEGAEALVIDVKYGSGAFMKEKSDAQRLAASLVSTGTALGIKVAALLTDMDQPLGLMTGNFLEVEEALDCLEGKGPSDLMELTMALAACMAVLGFKAKDTEAGLLLCSQALASGRPRQLFLDNIADQGGDAAQLLALRGVYRSAVQGCIRAARSGFVARIDAGKVGRAGVLLGIGRSRTEDSVCPTAGVQFHRKAGASLNKGDCIMTVWAKDRAGLEAAMPQLQDAVEYSDSPPPARTLIGGSLGASPYSKA